MIDDKTLVDNIHDPVWRLHNLYKIVNKAKKTVPFVPNNIQRKLLKNPSRFEATLKMRQGGVSTYYLLRLLDRTMWYENQTNCILAHEQDSIKKLFRIVTNAYKFMDKRIQPRVGKGGGSMYELYFPAVNSRIYCDLESRSDTISNLHVSEYAFVKDPDKVRATMDAVPVDTGSVSIETTANGMNHFNDEWEDPNWIFKRYFFPWYFQEEYRMKIDVPIIHTEEEIELIDKAKRLYNVDIDEEQIAFRRFKINQRPGVKGKYNFLQEYPEDETSCFLMSGEAAMDLILVKQLKDEAPKPVIEKNGFKIWEPMKPGEQYVCGVDVAEGIGKDWSVAAVYRASDRTQVAQCRYQRLKPGLFAEKVYDLCKLYQGNRTFWPLLGVERNNHGHAVLLKLEETYTYPNLYSAEDKRIGWKTTKTTRPIMIDTFIEAVEDRDIIVKDVDTLGECMTLVDNNGKIEALEGKNDDCVVASAIALQMITTGGLSFTQNITKM